MFPPAPEPIVKADGKKKNDRGRNASKRLPRDTRREHPHLKPVVAEDPLASNGPHIGLPEELDMRFVPGVKPGDHARLFQRVDATPGARTFGTAGSDGTVRRFRYLNGAPLNDAHFELEVNFPEYWETRPDGRVPHFSRVTDLRVDDSNAFAPARAGRARWRIGNETFNTPENRGHGFGHNHGHGGKHPATVFAFLMMPAFLIDRAQQRCRALFRAAKARAGRAACFRRKPRSMCPDLPVPDRETLHKAIAFGFRGMIEVYDTS